MLRPEEEGHLVMQRGNGNGAPSGSMIVAGAIILILLVVVVVAGITVFQLPDPVTEQGVRVNNLYIATLIISGIVYFVVTAGIVWAIFRYKRKSADEFPEQIHGSSLLEVTWTVIPIIILVALFIPALVLVIDLKTPPADGDVDIEVEAIGHQWWWEFVYPDEGVRVQQTPPNYEDLTPPALVVPVGQTVRIRVRSTDVIHSFYAPHTLYKIQAIPGNVNQMHFKVEKEGVYYGQCYQFCGLRHSDMLFVLDARSQDDFDDWLTEEKARQGLPANDTAVTNVPSGARTTENE
jgi:cytochrome c oxidase subunit 2